VLTTDLRFVPTDLPEGLTVFIHRHEGYETFSLRAVGRQASTYISLRLYRAKATISPDGVKKKLGELDVVWNTDSRSSGAQWQMGDVFFSLSFFGVSAAVAERFTSGLRRADAMQWDAFSEGKAILVCKRETCTSQ
jgi:hypothetical protein